MVNAAAPDLSWSVTWEDDISDHAGLATLLARSFPHSRTPFGGMRSWSSGRPELRLVGRAGAAPVAHLGVLRRFLRIAVLDASVLVGDVGLVAVDPDMRRRGVGAELLGRAGATLRALDVPFGFLTCGTPVAPFYAAAGWVRVDNPTRMVRADGRVQVYGGASMVLPVQSALASWPAGVPLDRNGLEVWHLLPKTDLSPSCNRYHNAAGKVRKQGGSVGPPPCPGRSNPSLTIPADRTTIFDSP